MANCTLSGLVVLLFGRGKISDLMGDVAKGIKSFKKGMSDNPKILKKTQKIETIQIVINSNAQLDGLVLIIIIVAISYWS